MTDPTPDLREEVEARIRRFAVLRAAQRALAPSFRGARADVEALRAIRERLASLLRPFDRGVRLTDIEREDIHDQLRQLDGALEGYAGLVRRNVESISLPQLRATLSVEKPPQRGEVLALLEVCMEADLRSSRHLSVVDLLLTLLCTSERNGIWVVGTDPANLHDVVRRRCAETPPCGSVVEASIVSRFRDAAERLGREDGETLIAEMSAYKAEIAEFLFVPGVLRCIVGYNAAARNYMAERLRRGRELDLQIDAEIGMERPLADYEQATPEDRPFLPAHESPGVLAVQEAIGHRIAGESGEEGPAQRIAGRLDLSWLDPADRQGFLQPRNRDFRLVRMTVVLGHLAVCHEESRADVEALGLHPEQIDAWICALGDEIQSEIHTRILTDVQGAVRLGDVKSRFLTAVLLVARRRREGVRPGEAREVDTFQRDAIAIVREYLEARQFQKPPPMFLDLLGGGWRRTVALAAVGLLIASVGLVHLQPAGPRATRDLSERRVQDLSPYLESAYRDHAEKGSMFVAVAKRGWADLEPTQRRAVAETVLRRVMDAGVRELMIFDADRVLQAHYKAGRWRSERAWKP